MEDVELNLLKDKLEDVKIEKEQTCTFYKGIINGISILLCCSNIGSINATIATTLGIYKYRPKIIIVQGIAGGHGENVHTKDIVVGTEIININSMETLKKEKGEGSNSLNWELNSFQDDKQKEILIQKSSDFLIKAAKNIEYNQGNILYGRIGSGDVWNKETDRILMFNEKYKTLCEEMEGYAVAKVANDYNIPILNIRVISNNEILREEYLREVGKYAQEFTLTLLNNIFSKNTL